MSYRFPDDQNFVGSPVERTETMKVRTPRRQSRASRERQGARPKTPDMGQILMVGIISRLPVGVLVPLGSLLLLSCGPVALVDNVENPGPIEGSFSVSDYFSASGYMGDGMTPDMLTAEVNENCKARPHGAEGNCYRFELKFGEEKWGGVYFQYPANNWGSEPGRSIDTAFERARFTMAAEYSIVLPAGGGISSSCSAESPCRNGLSCEGGSCAPSSSTEDGAHCLVSQECQGASQCLGQKCAPAGEGVDGSGCGVGRDELCQKGFRCSPADGVFGCRAEGNEDVGGNCQKDSDCLTGLYCKQAACSPRTLTSPFNFQVGGIRPTRADLKFSDEIGVGYFALAGKPEPILSPDYQEFEIDLSTSPQISGLIGAFMWAVPFPNADELGDQPIAYLADRNAPLVVYLDHLIFEEKQ